jgi:universal stress protein E
LRGAFDFHEVCRSEQELVMKILCTTDLLPKSDSAIDRAGMLAERLGAELSILHVVRPTESDQMLHQDMQRATRELKFRVGLALWKYGELPNVCVRAGNPARILIETLKELAPDLVVLGRHQQRPAWGSLAGTMAARVLSERKYPVLIVDRMAWHAYHNIVLGLDRTTASAGALRVAEALVLRDSVRKVIVHAYQPPYDGMLTPVGTAGDVVSRYSEAWSHEAEASLRARLTAGSNDFSGYELIVENATPSEAIQNVVRRVRPDLLVLGTRGRGRMGRAVLGSVANRVTATARCDVLVVPDGTKSATTRRDRVDRRSLDVITGV